MLFETKKLKEYPTNKDLFDNLPKDEYSALRKDIQQNGIKTELHIKEDGVVLCGHQRLKVARDLGIEKVPVKIVNPENDEEYVVKDNLLRRQLTNEQRAFLFDKFSEKYQGRYGGDRKGEEYQERHNVAQEQGKTAELVAKEVYGEDLDEKSLKSATRKVERYIQYGRIIKEMPDLKNKESMAGAIREYKKRKYLEEKKDEIESNDDKESFILLGDSAQKLKDLPDNSVDCVVTDPPYGIDYEERTNSGKNNGSNVLTNANKNFEDGKDYAIKILDDVCKELKRVCKPDAHLYFFFASNNYPEFREVLEKYFIIDPIPFIWEKDNFPIGRDVQKQYMICYEPIFFCRNDNKDRLLNRSSSRNIIKCNCVMGKMHPTQKPLGILKHFILNSTIEGEVVLDPFSGSGATLVAAKEEKRKYIGIERDEDYFKLIQRRLKDYGGVTKII